MNVAVGGTGGYWHDSLKNEPYDKPWLDSSHQAPKDFWLAKDQWYPTWHGEAVAMQVDYVKVYAYGGY